MRKRSGIVTLLLIASCAGGSGGGGSGGEVKSNLARDAAPSVPDADKSSLAAGNRAFALDLYGTLIGDPLNAGKNLFLSPHSISIALAMTYAGAVGDTATQMAQSLRFTLPDAALHKAFDRLDLTLAGRGQQAAKDGEPFQLSVADATWGQAGFPFLAPYLDVLAVNYGAGLHTEDFATDPESARQDINAWVAGQTADRIPELLAQGTVTSATDLVLTNAIYFKASWKTVFDARATDDAPFHKADGTDATASTMHVYDSFPYAEGDGFQAVALPYVGDDVSMLVVLPAAGTFAEFESRLDGDSLGAIVAALAPVEGSVALPKFGVESAFSLHDALIQLGIVDAFDASRADFSGMDGARDLSISDVIHKSFVAVDEAGTEAAAATAVIMDGSALPTKTFSLVADRPFLFAIIDGPTGAVLFLGRVLDPTAK